MRAVIYAGAGGPEVITLGEVPKPEVRPGHIRVRVHAAGLNRADLHPAPGQLPGAAGLAGGHSRPGVRGRGRGGARRLAWKVGDRVMGLVGGGAQAELVTVHQDEALAIPAGALLRRGGRDSRGVPHRVRRAGDAGRLAPGERVLIHAVGSGVGTAAAQIAKHLGATVLGTSRSAEKLARATVYGLDVGIDTSQAGVSRRGGRAGARDARRARRPRVRRQPDVLAPRGRLVLLGFLAGSRTTADLGPILRKRLEVIGTMMRTRGLEERAPLVREFTERMLPLFDHRIEHATPLRPVLERTYPDDRAGRGAPAARDQRDVRQGGGSLGGLGVSHPGAALGAPHRHLSTHLKHGGTVRDNIYPRAPYADHPLAHRLRRAGYAAAALVLLHACEDPARESDLSAAAATAVRTLTISGGGSGTGTVTSSPAGINCTDHRRSARRHGLLGHVRQHRDRDPHREGQERQLVRRLAGRLHRAGDAAGR